MLAPIIIGIAFLIVSVLLAISPTIIVVVEDEDCTMAVARSPVEKPTNGFVVFWIRICAKLLPRS